jgi:hypothetical protein
MTTASRQPKERVEIKTLHNELQLNSGETHDGGCTIVADSWLHAYE